MEQTDILNKRRTKQINRPIGRIIQSEIIEEIRKHTDKLLFTFVFFLQIDIYAGSVYFREATGWNIYISAFVVLSITAVYVIVGKGSSLIIGIFTKACFFQSPSQLYSHTFSHSKFYVELTLSKLVKPMPVTRENAEIYISTLHAMIV